MDNNIERVIETVKVDELTVGGVDEMIAAVSTHDSKHMLIRK